MYFFQVFSRFLWFYWVNWSLHFTKNSAKKGRKIEECFVVCWWEKRETRKLHSSTKYCFSKTIEIVWVYFVNYFKMTSFHTILWFISDFQFPVSCEMFYNHPKLVVNRIIFQRQTNKNNTHIKSPLLKSLSSLHFEHDTHIVIFEMVFY